jgi:hypothetical protein
VKTTIDLPSELVRAIKLRALNENRRLKEVVTDLLRSGLKHGGATDSVPQKGRMEFPLFATTRIAPASHMSTEALIALEQSVQLEEDQERHG